MEGRNFGDVPLNLELKLEVWDSPNSAGVIIDAVRCAKLALDRGIGGPLLGPSAYFMKSPPVQYHDDVAQADGRGVRRRSTAAEVWPAGLTRPATVRRPGAWPRPGAAPPGSRRRPASSSPRGPSSSRSSMRNASACARPPGPGATPEQLHHLVAVRSGRRRLELLLLAELGDARLELVHPPGQRTRLAGVAGRAVAAGQLVQPVEKLARRRARSGAPPCRSNPGGRCGSAGGARPAAPPCRRPRPSSAAPPCASRVMRAPTTSWWWKVTPPSAMARVRGLPTSWKSAASRSRRSGEVLSTTASVWASTSLWRWIGSCSSARPGSSGRNSAARPVSHHEPQGLGRHVEQHDLVELVADPLARDDGQTTVHRFDGRLQRRLGLEREAGDEAGGAQHAQRVVAEGDLGVERACAAARRPGRPGRRRGRPAPCRAGAGPSR